MRCKPKVDRFHILKPNPKKGGEPFIVAGTAKDRGEAEQRSIGVPRSRILDTKTWMFIQPSATNGEDHGSTTDR